MPKAARIDVAQIATTILVGVVVMIGNRGVMVKGKNHPGTSSSKIGQKNPNRMATGQEEITSRSGT